MQQLVFADVWYVFVLGAIVSYFLGCFNFAVLISHIKHSDIRHIGSGNPGTMNMTRAFGLKIGLINFFCDGLKGAIPVLCGYFMFRNYCFAGTDVAVSDFARYFFGIFAVIGHVFPVTMKFKGGKGIATTIGLFWCALACDRAETWWFVFVGFGIFAALFIYLYITEWGAMASLIGVSGYTIWQAAIFIVRYSAELTQLFVVLCFMLLLAINIITWTAHRKNLVRLMAGEEHRTSLKKKVRRTQSK